MYRAINEAIYKAIDEAIYKGVFLGSAHSTLYTLFSAVYDIAQVTIIVPECGPVLLRDIKGSIKKSLLKSLAERL